jgi:hypothetical protein
MHSVIKSATGAKSSQVRSATTIARRIFFDYPEILKEWHTNPRFTDATGKPAALPLYHGRRSFYALVRLVAPQADPMDALDVLTRTQSVVRERRNIVRARNRVLNTSSSNSLNAIRMFCVVDAMLTVVERSFRLRARERFDNGFYERAATSLWVDARYISQFRDFLREQGDDFMQTVDEWLAAHSVPPSSMQRKAKTCRVGAGVYMFADQ